MKQLTNSSPPPSPQRQKQISPVRKADQNEATVPLPLMTSVVAFHIIEFFFSIFFTGILCALLLDF